MAYTQADIDALERAVVDRKFVRSMTFSDRSVTFDSIDDMRKLLAMMRSAVSGNRTRYASTTKGL